jgi:hypothetical protein
LPGPYALAPERLKDDKIQKNGCNYLPGNFHEIRFYTGKDQQQRSPILKIFTNALILGKNAGFTEAA